MDELSAKNLAEIFMVKTAKHPFKFTGTRKLEFEGEEVWRIFFVLDLPMKIDADLVIVQVNSNGDVASVPAL